MPILSKPMKPLPEDANKKSLLHAVIFPKNKYTIEDAKQWLKFHNYKYIHNRDTINMHRFRIREQIKNYNFYTIKLKNGIDLVSMSPMK